ncbi:MAG: tetratricopeptide repeat protein [Phycisphaerales bacterium]|nr:tetratricopeptide repeat protein [Phycisphaerales bacterium]
MPDTKSKMRTKPLVASVAIGLCLCCLAGIAITAPSFDEQRKSVSASPATQSEAAIISLLNSGIAEDQPTQAIAVANLWLRQNVAKNPLLLYHAGRATELSGDWRGAVALYQQYLTRADLKSANAATATLAVYTLLIDQLDDTESAYAYMSSNGNRLRSCGRAGQFDKWFLDIAVSRKDSKAVAERLLTCIKTGVSTDLLLVSYDSYLRWLLNRVDTYCDHVVRLKDDEVAAYKKLSAAITFDDELKLRLDWAVSVMAYNQAKIAEKVVAPPIAEATALLAKYPHYAQWVQTGWAGGGNGRYYRNSPKKYWPHEIDAKMAPILAAIPKLTDLQRAELVGSWHERYYSGTPKVLETKVVRDYLLANPKLTSSRTGLIATEKTWHALKVEEVQKLAPLLGQCSQPEASMIRAMAAGGKDKDYDKIMAALHGPEVWRLGPSELNGSSADRLWHWAGRPGGNEKRDQEIAKSKAIAKTFAAGDVKKEDPAAKRIATFKKLWADFRSAQPKIPGVRSRLAAVLRVTPEVLAELLRDPSPETQMLVRDVIAKGMEDAKGFLSRSEHVSGPSPYRYDPSILRLAARHHGMDWLRRHGKDLYTPYPLEAVLRKAVSDQLKRGKAPAWLTMEWVNVQFPEDNAESVKVMAALIKSQAYKTLPYEVRYGVRAWFKRDVLTPGQIAYLDASDPKLACKDLLALTKDSDAATTAAALTKAIEGIKKAPVRLELVGLGQLALLDDAVFEAPKVVALMLEIAGPLKTYHISNGLAGFDNRLLSLVIAQGKADVLHATAPYFWHHTELTHHSLAKMMSLAESMLEKNPSVANTLARCGLQTFARHRRGHTYYKRETDIPRLKGIRGKASLAMGLIDIPVRPSDPSYPIYKSQAEFVSGNEDSARELYDGAADQLLPVHRELSVPYLLWVLQRTIDGRDEERQESLIKALMAWTKESTTAFSLDQQITLQIAYGDIAMQRGRLSDAHKIFTRIQKNKAYDGIFLQHTASLRRVFVERISKDFDAALKTLGELELYKIPRLITAAQHARAEVYYDMEEYEDAADEILKVLHRDPTHADATILRGRVQLKLKRLIEATEVELGTISSQKTLVPGEVLKVTLNDPTLAISSGGSEIEVVVWATSGDKEYLLLRQFGDVKTKYRGVLRTALGKPNADDRTLQIVGDDEIFYAYSERFRKKVTNLGENRGGPIKVASDAMMMASARKLLTESEQRVADMEAVTAAFDLRPGTSYVERNDPVRLAQMLAEAQASARRRMIEARAKPGNPIHVRVIDPDRCRTAEIDELAITASTSSGDIVSRIILKETGTHTGYFEGSVTTASAQAMAFGSTSETGRNPNMVISPKTGYASWRPVGSKNAKHAFTVDLNDNAPLGALAIKATDAGFGLKSFILQTAMNHKNWTTVARYPSNLTAVKDPWAPSVTVMADTDRYQMGGRKTVYELDELKFHLDRGWMTQQHFQGIAQNVAGPSKAMPDTVPTALKWRRQGRHNNCHVVYRFRANFYEPTEVIRRFSLVLGKHAIPKGTHSSLTSPPQFLLVVDGRAITQEGGKLEGELKLRAGLHTFEIWGIGWVESTMGFGRTTKLQANLKTAGSMIDCPDSFFDPATFPKGVLEHRNTPATITANDTATEFNVKFAPNSRARLMRLVFVDQEGPVPSLNRLGLTNPEGQKLLPVAHDYAELRKNQLLEILTGDKVTIRYVDDRYVTKSKEKHERFLNVAFTNARIEFADIEPRYSSRHQKKMPYHERYLRFEHDKPLSVVIQDADMDVSVEPDKVTFTIASEVGGKRQLVATETGPSTGIFKAFVTPVTAPTTDKAQIQVAKGASLMLTYRDAENTTPGVPTDRLATIEHAVFKAPVIHLGHMTIEPLGPEDFRTAERLREDFVPDEIEDRDPRRIATQERIVPHFKIKQTFIPSTNPPEKGYQLVQGRHALIDVVVPQLALGVASTVDIYVQTDAGRKQTPGRAFDMTAPNTLKITAMMGKGPRNETPQRAGYANGAVQGAVSPAESYEIGRFRAIVPLVSGMLPEYSFNDPDEVQALRRRGIYRPHGLVARAGELMHIGVSYKDPKGAEKWVTTSARIVTAPMLDVMAEGYRSSLTKAFVGEKLSLRVVDFAQDSTDKRDKLSVYMASKSGGKHNVYLLETAAHSGIFKGVFQLSYASAKPATDGKYDVKRLGFPVVYGDALGVRYTDTSGRKTPTRFVTIGKGSDGSIAPFSKQYNDSETAMRTQFAMAESYLELARRHSKTGEPKQAAREFVRAKQLLANAITQFNDPETRAHAEYLLGNLTQADAGGTKDPELRQARYHAALARFMKITGNYPDTEHASKAQFKIAVIYERMGESDIAAQEYVKLAYKYPDSAHLATAMARLGTHFQRKAAGYEKKAAPLLAKTDDKDAQHEGVALQTLSRIEYVKAAQIFERLQTRFPDNALAGKAGLYAGQTYIRAKKYKKAITALQRVIDDENYDGKTLRSEAMYWSARSHQTLNKLMLAYALYKRITYDFPESKWAAYARAKLSEERMLMLDQKLEIERLEEAGQ